MLIMRSLLPDAFSLADSVTTIPESEQSITDGKNREGITIASNIPN